MKFFFIFLFLALTPFIFADADILRAGEQLTIGKSLHSENGIFRVVMQEDGNLVIYIGNKANWASHTEGKGYNCCLKMQNDGNLVIYNSEGNAIWASDTSSEHSDSCNLKIQNDGNLVIYNSEGSAIWASGSVCKISKVLELYDVVYDLKKAELITWETVFSADEDVTNASNIEQTASLSLLVGYETVSLWTCTIGGSLTATTTFEAKIPFIAKGQLGFSATVNTGYMFGKTVIEPKDYKIDVKIKVPAHSTMCAQAYVVKAKMKIPFETGAKIQLQDGSVVVTKLRGTYSGSTSYRSGVNYREITKK